MTSVIAVSGLPGAGKSTTVRALLIALKLIGHKFETFNAGQILRDLHKKSESSETFEAWYGKTSVELNKQVDEMQAEFIKKHSTILEARFSALVCQQLGFGYFGIFVDVPIEVRSQRTGLSKEVLEKRQADEERKAKELYGKSHVDRKNYHLFVDTLKSTEDIVKGILENNEFKSHINK